MGSKYIKRASMVAGVVATTLLFTACSNNDNPNEKTEQGDKTQHAMTKQEFKELPYSEFYKMEDLSEQSLENYEKGNSVNLKDKDTVIKALESANHSGSHKFTKTYDDKNDKYLPQYTNENDPDDENIKRHYAFNVENIKIGETYKNPNLEISVKSAKKYSAEDIEKKAVNGLEYQVETFDFDGIKSVGITKTDRNGQKLSLGSYRTGVSPEGKKVDDGILKLTIRYKNNSSISKQAPFSRDLESIIRKKPTTDSGYSSDMNILDINNVKKDGKKISESYENNPLGVLETKPGETIEFDAYVSVLDIHDDLLYVFEWKYEDPLNWDWVAAPPFKGAIDLNK